MHGLQRKLPISWIRKLSSRGNLGGFNIHELDITPSAKGIDHSLKDPCSGEKPSEELTKHTSLDQTSQGGAELDWQEQSVQGLSLRA